MKRVIILAAFALGYFLIIAAAPTMSIAAPLGEVAIFTEQVSWIAQNTALPLLLRHQVGQHSAMLRFSTKAWDGFHKRMGIFSAKLSLTT